MKNLCLIVLRLITISGTTVEKKVTHTILKVHKDCETAGTDRAKIKFHHLKNYDKQGVFILSEIPVWLQV